MKSMNPPPPNALRKNPISIDGKIISELAKMIGMTPPWLTRKGR